MRTVYRYYWRLLGTHVHVRLFVGVVGTAADGPVHTTLALAGTLVFREYEWKLFAESLPTRSRKVLVELLHEDLPDAS